jgi:sec-independent protein translocase protein TatA
MDALSPMHLLIILLIVVILFGGSRIPQLMRGLGQGVKEFREGMRDDSHSSNPPANTTTNPPAETKK